LLSFASKRPTLNAQRPTSNSENPAIHWNNLIDVGMMSFVMSYRFLILLGCVFCAFSSSRAEEPKTEKPKQFIYILHLVPRLYDDKAWTERDKAAVEDHLQNFKEAVKSGQLILAGRTRDTADKTFGIAIFEVTDEVAARKFMESDPAVVAGVMTAELHPFVVVLQRNNP
jgi:uncharacterized protein YciI